MAICKSCGKTIEWGMEKNGKRIPLDPVAPTYHQQEDKAGVVWLVKSHSMVSHHATCPARTQNEIELIQHNAEQNSKEGLR